MGYIDRKYLLPTSIIDSDNERIIRFSYSIIGDEVNDPVEIAVRLYYAVRDRLRNLGNVL